LEKTEYKLNPTAHFPSINIAGNTFGKKCIEESIKPIHTILHSNMPFGTEENLCADVKKSQSISHSDSFRFYCVKAETSSQSKATESYTKNNGDNETHKYDAGYMRGK